MGSFAENDEVTIVRYHPAIARQVNLTISDEYSVISNGDWTAVVKPSLENKLLDYGRDVTFSIPWEGGAPIVATGTVSSTLPNPPVIIGDRTIIYIKKKTLEKLSKIQESTLKTQTKRVKILKTQIKQNTIKIIRDMKHKSYPNKGQKYEFSGANPKKVFKSVLTIFKGQYSIEKPTEKTFDEEKQDYLASAVFLIGKDTDSPQLIDVQVVGHNLKGVLTLYVTGKNDQIVIDSLEKYNQRIEDLKQGLEQRIELVETKCSGCGANLPIEDIDINGMVKCKYCRNISKIPKVLRY